jgi:hypothetical protein
MMDKPDMTPDEPSAEDRDIREIADLVAEAGMAEQAAQSPDTADHKDAAVRGCFVCQCLIHH